MRIVALACLAACAAGCTPSAIDVYGSRLAEFTPGVSTHASVLAALGPPKLDQPYADGSRAVIYDYAAVSKVPEDIDPKFPWRKRGESVRTTSVLLMFEPNGIMVNWRADATGRGS
jgi:hypothetical protein